MREYLHPTMTASLLRGSIIFTLSLIHVLAFSQAPQIESLHFMTNNEGTYSINYFSKPGPSNSTILCGGVSSGFSMNGYNTASDSAFLNYVPLGNLHYVATLDSAGNMKWIRFFSGVELMNITVDSSLNVYLTGYFGDLLTFNGGDSLRSRSPVAYGSGNVFLVKLDSVGKTKWMNGTDGETIVQAPALGGCIDVDPEGNVYLAGIYYEFIHFTDDIRFTRMIPGPGGIGFLAKLNANGEYQWVRDSGPEYGLPNELTVDSCSIILSTYPGAPTKGLVKKFSFAGELIHVDTVTESLSGAFANEFIKVKGDKTAIFYYEGTGTGDFYPMIGVFDKQGNNIWKVDMVYVTMKMISFTTSDHVFFAGDAAGTITIQGHTLYKGVIFGCIDENGNILWVRNIRRTVGIRDAVLSSDGRFMFNSAVNNFYNPYSYFGIDHITYNNLQSNLNYQIFATFPVNEFAYYEKPMCDLNPTPPSCLNRMGIPQTFVQQIQIPTTGTVEEGQTLQIHAEALLANTDGNYEWQDSTSSAGWKTINGANTSTISYSPKNTGDKLRSTWIGVNECVENSVATSNSLTFTVNKKPGSGVDTSGTGNPPPVSRIRTYPNPASTNLVIDNLKLADQWRFTYIVNSQGKVVFLSPYIQRMTRFVIDVQKLSSGLHTVILESMDGRRAYFKVIIAR